MSLSDCVLFLWCTPIRSVYLCVMNFFWPHTQDTGGNTSGLASQPLTVLTSSVCLAVSRIPPPSVKSSLIGFLEHSVQEWTVTERSLWLPDRAVSLHFLFDFGSRYWMHLNVLGLYSMCGQVIHSSPGIEHAQQCPPSLVRIPGSTRLVAIISSYCSLRFKDINRGEYLR